MKRKIFNAAPLPILMACLLNVAPAEAQTTRVFVSGAGADNNQCTSVKPCRTLQRAHDTVLPGGEIDVLDQASYGTLVITKAISIQGRGLVGTNGITVNAGGGDKINLSGLVIDGIGSSGSAVGIRFNTGASLNVQHSLIRNFCCAPGANGISFFPQGSSSLFVSDSIISDNNENGVFIQPAGSGTVTADFDRVLLENNPNVGLYILLSAGNFKGTFNNSTAARNGGGINVGAPGAQAALMVAASTIANSNNYGVAAGGGPAAIVRVTRSRITGNVYGLFPQDGTLTSYGDNNIDGNASDGIFTNTIVTK